MAPTVVRLRRGEATLATLAAALDRIGVSAGEDFAIVPVAAVDGVDDPDGLGPFARESDTSREAAIDNYPRAGSQRHRVLIAIAEAVIAGRHGLTRDELVRELELPSNSVCPRVWELDGAGWIQETEHRRRTQNGSEAMVLEPTPKGWDQLQHEGYVRPAAAPALF